MLPANDDLSLPFIFLTVLCLFPCVHTFNGLLEGRPVYTYIQFTILSQRQEVLLLGYMLVIFK